MLHSLRADRPQTRATLALGVIIVLIAALLAAFTPTAKAQAAELPPNITDGGYIISDAEFFDSDSMNAAQIQAFLDKMVPTCRATSGPACLKSLTQTIPAKAADSYCKAVPGSGSSKVRASEVIAKVALACGINPKVILVMLQKEQGLVTSSAPSNWNVQQAMGQACPDTPDGCNPAFSGFFNQVYYGARQLQVYTKNPTWFGYRAGQVNTIKWTVDPSCGTSKVFIQNQATANLYIYTPYRPNIAALAAGNGTGDDCSTYGNRNFYNYYVDWFAPSASTARPAALVAPCTVPAEADIVGAVGTATVTTDNLNARPAPTLRCADGTSLNTGAQVTVTGTYGMWTRAQASGKTVWLATKYLSIAKPPVADVCAQPSGVTAASGTVTTTDVLNVRRAPSDKCNPTIGQLARGQTVTRIATYGVWWQVRLANGTTGWIHSDYAVAKDNSSAVSRLSGSDRYETAVAVSKATFSPGVAVAYIAAGGASADALAGAPAAGKASGPLLLVGDGVPTVVADELRRLKPQRIVVFGGDGVVTERAMTELRGLTSGGVTRLAGPDRYDTSAAISRDLYSPGVPVVYVANGEATVDALAAAPLAGKSGAPIVLVQRDGVPTSVADAVKRLAPGKVVIVGGEGVVSRATADQLRQLTGVAVERLAGSDRFATAQQIARAGFSGQPSAVYLANGLDPVDALAAAPAAILAGGPVLPVQAASVPSPVAAELDRLRPKKIVVLGGAGVITNATRDAVIRYIG